MSDSLVRISTFCNLEYSHSILVDMQAAESLLDIEPNETIKAESYEFYISGENMCIKNGVKTTYIELKRFYEALHTGINEEKYKDIE